MDLLESYEQYIDAVSELELEESDVLSEEEFNDLTEEELQEISKATLGSYVAKSAADMTKQNSKHNDASSKAFKASVNKDRVKRAGPDKDYGETEDDHKERVGRLEKRKETADGEAKTASRKGKNRLTGIYRAGKRLAKEETEMNENENQEVEQIEETAALDSLKPNSKPVPSSKTEMMKDVLGSMSTANKGDLTHWFKQAMALWGPGKDHGVGDNSAKNSATIDTTLGKGPKTKDPMPKLNVKEDVEAMFDGQELSEEFKESAAVLFEAAVSAKVISEVARLEEEYEVAFNEEVEAFAEATATKLDQYLDYVTESWMKENEVAIESTLRNELMEEFIDGLKNLFAENYINVPEQKVDVLEALADKVSALESKLDDVITENAELKGVLAEETAKNIFEELASDLALTQQEKFADLAEGIEFTGDLDTYEKKLKIIKENYFKTAAPVVTSNIEEETFEGELTESVVAIDPVVNKYVQAISRSVKN